MFESSILKAFLTLSGFVGLLWGLLIIVKKYAKRNKTADSGIKLKVVSRVSLQAKTHMYVIEAGNRTLLVGVTDHNISTLADLTEETEIPEVSGYGNKTGKAGALANQTKHKAHIPADSEDLSFGTFLKSAFKRN